MVLRISALSAPVSLFSYTGELCHVLQYASSLFGIAVMAIWFLRLPGPEAQTPSAGRGGGPLLIAALLLAAAAAGGFETVARMLWHMPTRYHLLYLLITRTTAWFALLYTAAGAFIARGRRGAVAAVTG
jgi:hypothetical protein